MAFAATADCTGGRQLSGLVELPVQRGHGPGHRVLKLARTIPDRADAAPIGAVHLAEALQDLARGRR
jgi:hypothetical protein